MSGEFLKRPRRISISQAHRLGVPPAARPVPAHHHAPRLIAIAALLVCWAAAECGEESAALIARGRKC